VAGFFILCVEFEFTLLCVEGCVMKKALYFMMVLFFVFITIISAETMTPEKWCQKGKEYEDQQDYDKAIKMYENAIDEDYKFGLAYYAIANVKAKLGLYSESLQYIDYALKYSPDDFFTFKGTLLKSLYYACNNNFSTAHSTINILIQSHPDNPEPLYYKGLIYETESQWHEAQMYYNKILEIDNGYKDVQERLNLVASKIEGDKIRLDQQMSSNQYSGNSCATPYCYHMVWGYVCNTDGKGVPNIKVTLDEVRTAQRTEVYTSDSGLYLFTFYKNQSGNVNVSAVRGGSKTILLKEDTAIRQDFDYKTGFGLNLPPGELESSIVYITEYGDKYHRYGCQYLRDSCYPMPYNLVKNTHEPCSECW